tara:strand:- start:291 stop:893 length:603 start_codon:yes stop_codon:yes gene_type:complete
MIIDKLDLELWMISLIGNHNADAIRTVTIPKWKNEGFVVNLFNAITPKTIHNSITKLDFGYKNTKSTKTDIEFTETEKAIWYSHFHLWQKCVEINKPLLIIEEDVKPIKKFKDTWQTSYYKDSYYLICFCFNYYNMLTPAGGYIITPNTAKNMINNILKRKITYNVDYYIVKWSDIELVKNNQYAIQIKREMRTISHNSA